jgi:hypothetical protein
VSCVVRQKAVVILCVVRYRPVLTNVRSKRHLKLPDSLLYNSPVSYLVQYVQRFCRRYICTGGRTEVF